MSSVEGVAHNITEAAAAIPSPNITAAAEHLAAAYGTLAGIESDYLSETMQTVDGAYALTIQVARRYAVGQSALQTYAQRIGMVMPHADAAESNRPEGPEAEQASQGASHVDSIFAQVIAETVANGGEVSNRAINMLLSRAGQLGAQVIEALRDPAQSARVLQAIRQLQALPNEPYAGEKTKKVVEQAISALLYGDGGAGLRDTVTSGEPGVADNALEILGATYGTHPNHDPQTTGLLTERLGTLFDSFARTPPATPGRAAYRERLATSFARLLADASPEELTQLVNGSTTAKAGGSEYARMYRGFYAAAVRKLAHHGELRAKLFKRAGLDFTVTTRDWTVGNSHIVHGDQYFVDNTESIIQLEAHRAGTCQQLATRLGVHNFSRYPIKVLQEAREALDNPPGEYILFMSAKSDHNGALSASDRLKVLHEEIKELSPDCKLIPVELDTIADAIKMQHRLRRRGWGQASHVIANGHSSESAMHVGTERFSPNPAADGKNRWLRIKALLRATVAPGGTIAIIGCSSGKGEDSLAQHVADGSRRETTAPGQVITLKGLHAEPDPVTGKPKPVVTYGSVGSSEVSPTLTFTPA